MDKELSVTEREGLGSVVTVVDVAGDARTRGKIFGEIRRHQINAWIVDWLGSLRANGIADPQEYIDAMLRETDFLTAIREHTPDVLEEVLGISEAAGQSIQLLLAAQFMDEEWAFRLRYNSKNAAVEKCSSLAIKAQKDSTWIGQNMDLGRQTDGHQVVLRIAPAMDRPGALVFTIGGMIGLMGVNSRGVGLCVNSLRGLPSAHQGLPVAFVIRRLLQTESVDAASAMLRMVPHATSQHYLIADPNNIRSFEVSATEIVEYRSADPCRVLHTNHTLADEDVGTMSMSSQIDSVARLHALRSRLMSGHVCINTIKAALSSSDDVEHPVCKAAPLNSLNDAIGFTTGSMISLLQHKSPTIASWISCGPPCRRGYVAVHLRR